METDAPWSSTPLKFIKISYIFRFLILPKVAAHKPPRPDARSTARCSDVEERVAGAFKARSKIFATVYKQA